MATFSENIISWYKKNRRDLPWRYTSDPYKIWVSEIILQQTRVNQGRSYYLNFINRFPDVQTLARASTDEVLKLWQGLGYYHRAVNIHKAAEVIVNKYDGVFPGNHDSILRLPGIGSYTAAAIASIAFNKPYPVIDGNVQRVISRICGIRQPVTSTSGRNKILEILLKLIQRNNPSLFNQAIMEFGAIICTPANPGCPSCVCRKFCFAFKHNMVKRLPVKKAKKKPVDRYFNYLFLSQGKYFWMKKRKGKDIFQNLYELPLIETGRMVDASHLRATPEWKKFFQGAAVSRLTRSMEMVHHLSHQIIHARFWRVENSYCRRPLLPAGWIKVAIDQAGKYPVPKIIETFFKHHRVG